ncbi:MAG: thioesterase-like protein [Gammaproteobacteria bacterium]|nr:thioesterase-like protein [Gammaproteobacteria bacterium]
MSAEVLPADGIVHSHLTVLSEWLDYNRHMNVAYYLVAFEQGIEDVKCAYGLDAAYRATKQRSTAALEAHLTYQNEANEGERLRVETRILDTDGKRLHLAQALYRGDLLLATQEVLSISFDLAARRSCSFEPELAVRIAALIAAQATLPRPGWVGRAISLKASKPAP